MGFFQFGDIRSYRYVFHYLVQLIQYGDDGGFHPIESSVLGPVFYGSLPYPLVLDRTP